MKKPCPVQIFLAHEDDRNFELDEEALEQILLQEHIRDLHIVVKQELFIKGNNFYWTSCLDICITRILRVGLVETMNH